MNRQLAQSLQATMSAERLQPYLTTGDGDLLAALRLYAWNIEISAAFHGPLHCVEIALRNALHRELSRYFQRADWWNSPRLALDRIAQQKVDATKAVLAQAYPAPTPGHMVAALTFGFWVNLLAGANDYENRLWRPALHRAFPAYRGTRRPLHRDLYHLRLLRNRVAHYEPILHRHLSADHRNVLRVLGYLSPETADWVRANDRVPEVLARRTDVCAAAVPTRF